MSHPNPTQRPAQPPGRHLADHDAGPATEAGLRRFLGMARREGVHPAVRALHAARPAAPAEGRLRPFLRILRGRVG